ncbi:hypothetical protein CsatB_002392 [Cannabis sativa]
MGLLSNSINKRKLKPGDHIYCYRTLHLYSHHGIYVGDNMVIHYQQTYDDNDDDDNDDNDDDDDDDDDCCEVCGFNRKKHRGVIKTCLDCFLNGHHRVFRFEYQVSPAHFFAKRSGTCSVAPRDPPNVVIQRATEENDNNKFGQYDLMKNNCESFATYCMTGKRSSEQASSVQTTAKVVYKSLANKPISIENLAKTAVEAYCARKLKKLEHIQQHQKTK